ncbi:hypothetical protein BsWGS_24284 [Bradybaena similaris]
MESIEQPFDSITRITAELPDTTNDKAGLIDTDGRSKRVFNGDSPRAESSPLHEGKSTNSILHGPQNRGLRIIIISSVVFAIAVTVALILTIYLEPKQVHGHAAISCEDVRCSNIGLQVLQDGGNAVDAAVAAAFCLGVVNPAHSGIGGGGFAIVHDHKFQKSLGYNFRETAPAANQGTSKVGVPGMVKGLAHMHKIHGKLNWQDLLQPAIELAHDFSVSEELARALREVGISEFKRSGMDGLFLDKADDYKNVNDTVIWNSLAASLRKIQHDPDSLYTGELNEEFVNDQPLFGSSISSDDLRNYSVRHLETLTTKFKELTVVGLPPPASGALTSLMLNMIDKLNWKDNQGNDSITYHQLIEVYKFAYAHKSILGDPAFNLNMDNITAHLISPEFAAELVANIRDNTTSSNISEYGTSQFIPSESTGMTHISVIDSSELMVSATLGINSHFGSKILLPKTGILLNNALEDFNESPNAFEPGKSPLSSMSPTVMYNAEHPCAHRLIIGASNGEKILTGIVETVVNSVVFKMSLADAVAAPRVHDQLVPSETLCEGGIPPQVVAHLKSYGHNVVLWNVTEGSSMVMGIEKTNDDIHAYSDLRKFGTGAQY